MDDSATLDMAAVTRADVEMAVRTFADDPELHFALLRSLRDLPTLSALGDGV